MHSVMMSDWVAGNTRDIPFVWLGAHMPWLDRSQANYPHLFRSENLLHLNSVCEHVAKKMKITVMNFSNMTRAASRRDFLGDGFHTSTALDSVKAVIVADFLGAGFSNFEIPA